MRMFRSFTLTLGVPTFYDRVNITWGWVGGGKIFLHETIGIYRCLIG